MVAVTEMQASSAQRQFSVVLAQWGSGRINPRMENLVQFSYAMADVVKLTQCVLWIYIF